MKSEILEVSPLCKEEYLEKKVENNNFFNITSEKYVLNEINIKTEDFLFSVKFLKLSKIPIIVSTDCQGIIKSASIDKDYLDDITEDKAKELKEIFTLAKTKVQEFTAFAIKNNIK